MKTHNPSNLKLIDYRKLRPFQQGLKDLSEQNYAKLKKSIETHGYFVPAFVWFKDDIPYIIDSHQRHRFLMTEQVKFENTGYEIPYVEIQADNEQDAKKKLLVISSQYGKITAEGWTEFTADLPEAELLETVAFDAINPDSQPTDTDETQETCETCGQKLRGKFRKQ